MERSSASDALQAQREYALRKAAEKLPFHNFAVGDAFVRGIRNLGYKSTADALNEIVDNSIEAGATTIQIGFGFGANSDAKPENIWIADNGHGMVPNMIRLAVMWGGTHREDSRRGYGRFGFGLPSACVSIGKRFTVYSKTADEDKTYRVIVDLDDMRDGKYNTSDGSMVVPEPEEVEIPEAIKAIFDKTINKSKHMTVVVIEKLDKISHKTASRLQGHLVQRLGLTYRNILRNVRLMVNTTGVEPVDPLFLMPEARYYDLDEDRAEPRPAATITVKPSGDRPGGDIRVRFSLLPPTFQRIDKNSNTSAAKNMNERFPIMKENNGFIICRNGRQIDVVTNNPWTTFLTYDRNIKIEVDFDASLDEEFGVTTSKQQITFEDRIWQILKENRIDKALEEMRQHSKEARASESSDDKKPEDEKKPSEVAIEQAQKVLKRSRAVVSIEKDIAAQKNLDRKIKETAKNEKLPLPAAEEKVKKEIAERPYLIQREASPEGPFYRTEQIGAQINVYLNTSHRFFLDLYAGPNSSKAVRDALEVLLFVLAEAELNANPEYEKFYKQERPAWSRSLAVALGELEVVRGSDVVEEEHEPATAT